MNKKSPPSKEFLVLISIITDSFLVFAADITAFVIRFGLKVGPFPRINFTAYLQILFPVIVLRLLCFYIYGLYDKPKYKTAYDTFLNVVKASTVSTLIIIVVAFISRAFAYPRLVIFLSWLITIPLIIIWRLLIKKLINWVLGKDYFTSHTLILGTNREAHRIATRLLREANISRRLVGFVSTGTEGDRPVIDTLTLGTIDDLPRIITANNVDEVVVADPRLPKEKILNIFSQFSRMDIIFRIVPNLYEAAIGTMASSATGQVPLISPISRRTSWYSDLKRLLDTTLAAFGLILLFPLMLLVAMAIKLTSSGTILYKQKRAGLHGRVFTLYKFRTMFAGSEKDGPAFAKKDDLRITPAGKVLRRFRFDELPQLYNVLVNDMSIVGPRPERPYFVKELIEKIPFYAERLETKPGITGWAQVTYGYASTLKEHQEKLLYDIFYLENMSLTLDIMILLKTLMFLVKGKGTR